MIKEENSKKSEEYIKHLRERKKLISRRYHEKNREKINEKRRSHYSCKKKSILRKIRRKYKGEQKFYIEKQKLVKNLLYNINLEYKVKKIERPKNTEDILGCSYEDFFLYIEKDFNGWVSWKDYGYKKGNGYTCWILVYKDKSLKIIDLNNFNNFEIKVINKN